MDFQESSQSPGDNLESPHSCIPLGLEKFAYILHVVLLIEMKPTWYLKRMNTLTTNVRLIRTAIKSHEFRIIISLRLFSKFMRQSGRIEAKTSWKICSRR
jgi:hypothetical protein